MKRMLLLLLMLVALSHQQCLTQDDTKLQTDPKARLTLYAGQQEFSLDMLRVISSMNKNTNIFFSPSSVYSALLLAYFGAANQTEDSLKKTLHINADQDKLSTMQAYRLERFFQAMRAANGSGSYELRSPSRIYLSNNLRLRECMEQLFHDEVVQINFLGDPENSRLAINEWVEQQTKRLIKNLISEGKVTPSTSLVLVNAAYFKGLWQSQFLAQHTRKEVFFISASEQTLVPMMKQKGTFNHRALSSCIINTRNPMSPCIINIRYSMSTVVSERLGAHVLELPYKGKDVSMFLFLPPFVKNNAVDSLIKQLDHESLAEIVAEDGLFARQVEIMVPKFSIEQELDLTPVGALFGTPFRAGALGICQVLPALKLPLLILEQMGVGDLFTETADLSGFTGQRGLLFDDAVHKARIDVDEKGTEAAAATAMLFFRSSRPLNPLRFVCNHPFIYLLFDRVSQTVLFMGIYRRPN
uniref:Serpin domain-containing protein n=1 Tax=Timema monikensis TaxID=170555 RepID=A0A7R9HKY3_9NEOP|nr:unnamed protein product [Timema monikensis]